MVRKYAGPLQPGKRSAYVPKTKARRSRPTRITSKSVAKQTSVNRVVAKVMSKINETKVQEMTKYFHKVPVPINSSLTFNNPTHMAGYVIGRKPANWTSGLVGGGLQYDDLESFEFPQGTQGDQRVGDFMWAKRSTANLNIMMKRNIDPARPAPPYRFRCIVFRPKTSVRTPNNPSDPTTDLFINTSGDEFGHGSSTSIEFQDLWMSLLNKKDYYILSDKKFMLSSPGSLAATGSSVNYQADYHGGHSTDMVLKVPYNKKIRFDNATNLPEDLNMCTGIVIYAQAIGDHKENSELFETSIQGVSSFGDC